MVGDELLHSIYLSLYCSNCVWSTSIVATTSMTSNLTTPSTTPPYFVTTVVSFTIIVPPSFAPLVSIISHATLKAPTSIHH